MKTKKCLFFEKSVGKRTGHISPHSIAINESLAQTQWSIINEMGNKIIQAS